MGIHIIFSNHFEVLEKLLIDELTKCPTDPFEAQHVVVPSASISRRLQLDIAQQTGICANIRFNYLGSWLWHLARNLVADVPENSPVASEILTWQVLRLLSDGKFVFHPRLTSYLKGADDLMLLELAQSVAYVFDHYATYRPDWLIAWSQRKTISDFHDNPTAISDEEWQGQIWRAITAELNLGNTHPLQIFLNALSDNGQTKGDLGLPASAAIFAVPVIPPLYLQTICRLAEHMDITLYILNPCSEYWFEIVSPKRLAYLKSVKRHAHQEVGHSLLASWGRVTQSAIDMIYEEATAAQTSETTLFIEPPGETLIAKLQQSVLNMEELAPGSARMSDVDRSVEIHCCHGTVRELEVLHDRLLYLFSADKTLQADDIIVLTPEIDTFAPSIDAVFGTAPSTHFIPYVIGGRAMANTNPYLQVLLELLDLASSRLPASRVFDLLRQPPVSRRFGLDNDGLDRIRGWLAASGMRWGSDGEHRERLGVTEEYRHTLRWGLDRLFLGLAVPDVDEPLACLLPCDSLEGSRAETLGLLWLYTERLAAWGKRLQYPIPADEWQEILNQLLMDFTLYDNNSHREYDQVIGGIAELAANWRAANLTLALTARVVKSSLADVDLKRRGAVPSGAVTFAPFASMRGLNYRVICLVGMNDGVFPSQERPLEFDLIAKGKLRRGDRQRRLEERNTFLDALLAARDAVHISYVGRDQRNNTEMPPSVLVSQLIDYLSEAIAPECPTAEELKAARERLTVVHPLQPFSRRYFDGSDPRLFSYVYEYAAALNTINAKTSVSIATKTGTGEDETEAVELSPPFITGIPSAPSAIEIETPIITTDEIFRFLRNPSKFFLQRQLMIDLPERKEAIADEEPLTIGFSEERGLADMIIEACRRQNRVLEMDEALAIIQVAPESPPGAVCEAGLCDLWPRISSLATRVLEATIDPKLPPWQTILPINADGKIWQLKINLGDLYASGIIHYRCDELRGYDHLNAWIQHVVLCASQPPGVSRQTRHYSFDNDLSFAEISQDEAMEYLTTLFHLYRDGLSHPVPFFRKSAWDYVQKDIKAALRRWSGGFNFTGTPEGDDIWHALAWRGIPEPLDEAFMEIATKIYEPISTYGVVTIVNPIEK